MGREEECRSVWVDRDSRVWGGFVTVAGGVGGGSLLACYGTGVKEKDQGGKFENLRSIRTLWPNRAGENKHWRGFKRRKEKGQRFGS